MFLTKFYERMNAKIASAADNEAELKELSRAVEKAKEAGEIERAKANSLQMENDLLKLDVEQMAVKCAAIKESSDAEIWKLQNKLVSEMARLRQSRADCLTQEVKVRAGMAKGCEDVFEKVKAHLRDREVADNVKSLFLQARGTREALELVRQEEDLPVLDKSIALYADLEQRYRAEAGEIDIVDLEEADLVVPTDVEALAIIDADTIQQYGSNDDLALQHLRESAIDPIAEAAADAVEAGFAADATEEAEEEKTEEAADGEEAVKDKKVPDVEEATKVANTADGEVAVNAGVAADDEEAAIDIVNIV